MGATVERVRPVSIAHKDHFVNVARRRALEARAADVVPEAQLYDLTKEDPQLEKKLDQHVKNRTSAAHDLDAVHSSSPSPFAGPSTSSDSGASRPAAEDFVMSSEKEVVACIKTGVINCSDGKISALSEERRVMLEEVIADMGSADVQFEEVFKDDLSNVRFSSSGEGGGGYFADQFENLANFRAHYEGTGPEIWEQSGGEIDAFIAAAGTGGTIAGVSRYLKEKNPQIECYIIDPPGSGLYNRVTRGVMYTREEAEGKRLRNPFDTITEGIGINRITENFKQAQIDGAFRGTDKEAVEMARYLMRNDGLFVGSSSAMNCVGAVRVAQRLGPGHTIVTILCDSGARHLSKFQNADYLAAQGLISTASSLEFL